ncbi:MAG: adenosylmethionine--8-amino-7-oxononanoate transaminase [Epsilonproteobacteria bacterium]|nr:MAG: adenosylmethionine--8-amino-7-oxononanoate transaminase [Campylobacterota bacterium]
MDYLSIDRLHTWHPYSSHPSTQTPLLVRETYAQTIVLDDDTQLVDAMSSWWSAIWGYNHPNIIKALKKQANTMPHVMFGGLTHKPAIELTYKLAKLTKLPSIFLADSGSVAVEVALKTAILYQKAKGKDVSRFVALRHSYHGDTLGCMGVCDPQNSMHSLYSSYVPQNIFTSIENLGQTIVNHHKDIAGVIVEPIVQGAGGMRIHDTEYLKIARQLCSKYDLVLIADEIATGFGHTGTMWACDHGGITPDIMTVGKSLTAGAMTLSAMCATKNISDTISNSPFKALMHGPTYMGNSLACAVANASIDLFSQIDWQNKVANIQKIFTTNLSPLKAHKKVADVRCIGAIGVVELKSDKYAMALQKHCVKSGVWIRPFGKLLYSIVSYNITNDELEHITTSMTKAVYSLS